MSIRTRISMMIFMMIQAVLFFAGTLVTLMVTDQSDERAIGIVATIVISGVIAMPLSYFIAPRLRSAYVRKHVPAIAEKGL
jgi:hypothetical protein